LEFFQFFEIETVFRAFFLAIVLYDAGFRASSNPGGGAKIG
jgi:hypothetical protein